MDKPNGVSISKQFHFKGTNARLRTPSDQGLASPFPHTGVKIPVREK
jgi:hypothetical protein